MGYLIEKLNPFWIIIFFLLAGAIIQHNSRTGQGATIAMETFYIGRFSMAVPAEMKLKLRSSSLRYVNIEEIEWPQDQSQVKSRQEEWELFLAKTRSIRVPEGANSVIISKSDFPAVGKWIKGLFYHDGNYSSRIGVWTLLMDAGSVGVWLTGEPSMVQDEMTNHIMARNIENVAKSYLPLDFKTVRGRQPGNRFYLQHGAISLPYSEKETSVARFEGHPLNLTLLVEIEMDFRHRIETMGLIEGTRAMLLAALINPAGSVSKIRLRKREVAGMPGEESVLKVTEGNSKDLVFTWQFNGKDDSGEYPTTRIEMESHDHFNLHEKLEIWDAILDSMQPMFERKKL